MIISELFERIEFNELSEAPALGKELFFRIFDKREFIKFEKSLSKEDRLLMRQSVEKIIDMLTPSDDNVGVAINHISHLMGRSSTPENTRNQISKIANLLRIKVPHGDF